MTKDKNISNRNDIPEWLENLRTDKADETLPEGYFESTRAVLKDRLVLKDDAKLNPNRVKKIRLYTLISVAAAACIVLLLLFYPGDSIEYPAEQFSEAEKLFIDEYSYYELADLQENSTASDTAIENYLLEENNYYEMINLY